MDSKAPSSLPQHRLLAPTIGLAIVSASGLTAAGERQNVLQLDNIKVEAEEGKGYKTERSSSAKYVAPLLDTPQTITVVPPKLIQEQQALSLRQVLSNVSGITFNAGEGGGGSGDSINIRGFSANSNMQIDGLRDSAQTNRSDTFNIEQVEVIKGPNSVFGGAGTTGGSINLVSKQPKNQAFTRLGGSLGTDNYYRLTLDSNQPLEGVGQDSAVRINLMGHQNDVPDREQIDRERWGIAPSLRLGFSDATRLTLSAFHQTDDNLPDYGVPALDGKKLAGVKRDAYFGWKNLDKEQIEQNAFTADFEHDFSDHLRLQNLTRYSRTARDTIVSASHVNTSGVPAGRYRPAGPQAYGRDATTEMWINQSNLIGDFEFAGMRHDLVAGVELSRETLDLKTYSHGLGTALYPRDGYALGTPPGRWNGPVNKATSGYTETTLKGQAYYLFDTIALSERWDLNLGLRYDKIKGDVDKYSGSHVKSESLASDTNKASARTGLVFKPTENGRIYAAWGNSFNPSAENLASTGGGLSKGNQDLAPEKNETWELGTKWGLLDKRLELDGALFRVEKSNARETMADGSTQLAGKQRVQGVEIGVTGHVTEQWDVFANYTFLDSETLKAANTASGIARKGQALGNTPPRSLNLWTTYELPAGWTLGYGTRYVSERNVTSSTRAKLDAYWVHNAMLGYKVNHNLDLQLNVNNLFDKDYVERVRQQNGSTARSSAIEYGDARAAIMSATYSF
ncbi:TonB-dependent receptor [Pseudomonas chlororaphis]|uniref:TonB-dependent receptor BfrD n=1 Tax=Pseudomonas chlororaphis TaxID=587753 RepID=A0AAX3FP23_9PSED|nr:TonB-dependent siderophore receptor [Pseudomonas chlororaphis]AZC37493.1 Ferrichrome-iron receptor [Pseudomonas chlororaphis subsp. piscium]AZC44042.1 Ferrichrome-iron receptor [Pseudomonas chlororaphis subsp. piscium]WDG75887.1 TonB-dependent siderophore receptor [Pseudomonas chlororaphis]WDH26478.1 TonB-dependent siderophore receptor [Pseudomonas chlororaphis]WDH74405.1 TonB-dependent siderophore receptor [Pseudomonas chlororaphis]